MDSNELLEIKDEERTTCEIWTRVMGYYRPVSAFNKGKKSEYQERLYFSEQKTVK
jgi:anaerobic ribonucleoside-triphosphate reductase